MNIFQSAGALTFMNVLRTNTGTNVRSSQPQSSNVIEISSTAASNAEPTIHHQDCTLDNVANPLC
jgi:hypothetical protein